jgi:parallel beta-helix repeat protein
MKRISAIVMGSLLMFGMLLGFEIGVENAAAYTPHAPIYINGNADFFNQSTIEGWPGNGLESNPYIIENYSVDAMIGIGIDIRNTSVHFTIRDCWIDDGMVVLNSGIFLSNVTNGSVEDTILFLNHHGIELFSSQNNTISYNNFVDNNYHGIYLHTDSNNNTVDHNSFLRNRDGTRIELSSDNLVSTNTLDQDGIYVSGSSNDIFNNTIHSLNNHGIYLGPDAIWNAVSENSIYDADNGLYVEGEYNTIANNSIDSNHNNGIFVAGSSNLFSYNDIYANDENGISLFGVLNTLFNNSIHSNDHNGIWLFLQSNTIANNSIYANKWSGLDVLSGDNNISNNYIYSNNRSGISLQTFPCDDNIIDNNIIYSNNWSGIELSFNTHENIISNNYIHSNNRSGIHLQSPGFGHNMNNNSIYANNEYGVFVDDMDSNIISDNRIYSNDRGIYLSSSNGNTISDNNLSVNGYGIRVDSGIGNNIVNNMNIDNGYGIYLFQSSSNTLSGNNLSRNSNGVYLFSSNGNDVYHNTFISNSFQGYDDQVNSWNLPYPVGGNYWNDYHGKDLLSGADQDMPGSDGFGDTPYGDIDGGMFAADMYPLTRPAGAPAEGDILITSHDNGDTVSGTILIEAAATFPNIAGVNFHIEGALMGYDGSSPYQHILDTTALAEDASFEIKAEAVLHYGDPVSTSITLWVNNQVAMGNYISVSTLNPEYRPDEDVSVLVTLVSPPYFNSLELEVNCMDPSGRPLYTSSHDFYFSSEYRVILSIPSDAELGTYTVTVYASGFADDSLKWGATDSTTFLVFGMSLRNQLEELNMTLASIDLTQLLDALGYLNQTLSAKVDGLSLQLSELNSSLQSSILGMETNLLNELAGVNASLAFDIQNLLMSITNDLIGMNSSLSNKLTSLFDNLTTDVAAFRAWLTIVLGAIDTNLTETKATLEGQLVDLRDYMAGLNDSLKSDLSNVIADIQMHDSNTGQNHSDIISMLQSIQSGVGGIDITSLKNMLSDLASNVSTFDQSIAADIQVLVNDISQFEMGAIQKLDGINNTLDELARWENVLSKLEELETDLEAAEENLSASIEDVPSDVDMGLGVTEGLLIVVIFLLVAILLATLMGRRDNKNGTERIREEDSEIEAREDEEEEPEELEEI